MKAYTKLAIGCLVTVLLIVLLLSVYTHEGLSPLLDILGYIAFIALLLYMLILYYNYIKAQRGRYAEAQSKQPPDYLDMRDIPTSDTILYLRPFKIDDQVITEIEYGGARYRNIEPILCRMFCEAGFPVAIGNPDQTHAPDQAAHIAPSDQWQTIVTQLLEQSSHVILYVDFTEGVKWELAKALSGYKHKLILLPVLYNTQEKRSYAAALLSFFGISYILHSLRYHHFTAFKKWRRKKEYYRQWEATFPGFGFTMNDTVSAVIFDGERAVPFHAERPTLEAQFHAIQRAINTKLGVPMLSDVFIKSNEKPLFSLCGNMDLVTLPGHVAPFAMGQVDFYDAGFRFNSPFFQFTSKFNINSRHHYRKNLKYQKDQLLPYAFIEATQYFDQNGLRIVCEKANGSSELIFPSCHASCIGPLKLFLEQKRTGYSNPALANQLAHIQKVQETDYAIVSLLLEVFGLAAGVVLWLLSLGSRDFSVLLAVCSPFWHIAMALFYGFFFNALRGSLLPLILRWLASALQMQTPKENAFVGKLLLFAMLILHGFLFVLQLAPLL